MTYWEKRAAQDMARALRDAQAVIGDVEALHTQALTRITQMMHRIRTRFAKVYGLTQQEAQALLDAPCGREEYLALLEEIGTLAADNPLRATLLAKAAAPSYAFRESLGTAMKDQLTAMTAHLAGQEAGKLTEHLTQTAVEQSLRAGFRIQQQAGVGFAFGGISEELARVMIKTPWSGASFSARIWQNQSRLTELLNSVLREGLTTGRSTEAIAGDIANATGVSMNRARTLVRTETAYVCTQADMAAYEEAELDEIQFSAVLDMKTSRICQEMDGKIIKRSEAKVGENIPPMHPNCRSITTCVMSEEDKARMTRWARDPVTGEGVKVPADMTYKEWLALQKETFGEARIEAARKMAVNKKRDKAQFEAYRAVLGKKNLPASLEKFQAMKYTQSEEWEAVKTYARGINSGEVSPVSGIENYKDIVRQANEKLVGQTTSDGLKITGFTEHFVFRTIGSVEQRRNGVSVDDTLEALTKTKTIGKGTTTNIGRSTRYTGTSACVSLNPDTGMIIQVNPVHTERRRK